MRYPRAHRRAVAAAVAAAVLATTPVLAEYGFDLGSDTVGDAPAAASNLAARGDRVQTAPTTPPPAICFERRAFVIGDSLTVGALEFGGLDDVLDAAGYTARIDARQARFADGGANRLAIEAAAGRLEPLVVVGLGTNDAAAGFTMAWFADNIDKAMAAVGRSRTVLWINLQIGDLARQARFNDVLTFKSAQHPNLLVLDWASQPTRQYLEGDGIHLEPAGYRLRTAFMRDRMDWATCRRLPY